MSIAGKCIHFRAMDYTKYNRYIPTSRHPAAHIPYKPTVNSDNIVQCRTRTSALGDPRHSWSLGTRSYYYICASYSVANEIRIRIRRHPPDISQGILGTLSPLRCISHDRGASHIPQQIQHHVDLPIKGYGSRYIETYKYMPSRVAMVSDPQMSYGKLCT